MFMEDELEREWDRERTWREGHRAWCNPLDPEFARRASDELDSLGRVTRRVGRREKRIEIVVGLMEGEGEEEGDWEDDPSCHFMP